MSLASVLSASYRVECTSLITGLVSSEMLLIDSSCTSLTALAMSPPESITLSMARMPSSCRLKNALISEGRIKSQSNDSLIVSSAQLFTLTLNGLPNTTISLSASSLNAIAPCRLACVKSITSNAGFKRLSSSIDNTGY